MGIDAATAVRVAKKHGLSLTDARTLQSMADDEEEAERLAAEFEPEESSVAQIVDDIPRG